MNKKKIELLMESRKILNDVKKLTLRCNKICSEIRKISDEFEEYDVLEQLELSDLILNDKGINQVQRLFAALIYVANPCKETVDNLKETIKLHGDDKVKDKKHRI